MRLRLGTRRSKLALAQAEEVAASLRAMGAEVEIVGIVTSGDRGAPPPPEPGLAGVKGLFVGEIVSALRESFIDLAVHSAKDLPAGDPPGVSIGAVPQRASPFDVLIARERELPERARIGTGSVRRRAQLARLHPAAEISDLHGNVDTRLRRLAAGDVDAVVLAAAGLARLGVSPVHVRAFAVDEMVPAPGQGALAVQVRDGGPAGPQHELVKQLDHLPSRTAVDAERTLMAILSGGCDLPLGALAESTADGSVRMTAAVIDPDGRRIVRAEAAGPTAADVARAVADALADGGAREILTAISQR